MNTRKEEMKKENQRNRDKDLLEMVRGLLLSEVAFQEIFKKYKEGHLHFSDIGKWVDDKGQSLLYNLKERCHSLFRYSGKGPIHKNEWLLDLAIGSIFHEAMKLRENLYQMDVYQPKYLQYKSKIGRSTYEYETNYLQQFERIMSKAEQGLQEGMEETQSLFKDAMAQLVHFFNENSKNPFLARFLLEHQPLLQKVYGFEGTKDVFNLMFKKGLSNAYYLAGRSYLQSQHYDLSSLYSKALSYFSRLVPLRLNKKVKREYLRRAEEVCHKMSSELREEKGLKSAVRCRFLAEQIKKML
jgi:hypothetical protein